MIEEFEIYKKEKIRDVRITYYFRFKLEKERKDYYSTYTEEKEINQLHFELMYRIVENPRVIGKMFKIEDLNQIKDLVLNNHKHRLRNITKPYTLFP